MSRAEHGMLRTTACHAEVLEKSSCCAIPMPGQVEKGWPLTPQRRSAYAEAAVIMRHAAPIASRVKIVRDLLAAGVDHAVPRPLRQFAEMEERAAPATSFVGHSYPISRRGPATAAAAGYMVAGRYSICSACRRQFIQRGFWLASSQGVFDAPDPGRRPSAGSCLREIGFRTSPTATRHRRNRLDVWQFEWLRRRFGTRAPCRSRSSVF